MKKEVIQMGRFLFGVNYYTLLFTLLLPYFPLLLPLLISVVSVIQS